ncbi:MAG: metal ABC transporter permease [candidate division Zixibacteria bacterium]|nr:metal ABC transporter permease [candidate division Zixibacteria bacterium]
MTSAQIEIQLIAAVVAAACALPGVFLILRRTAMMSDAISHAILLGIVLAFLVTEDLTSPFLIVAATLTGVLTVLLVEILHKTRLVKEDAAIGLVFPVLFSIGVILIARFAGSVHLDTDAVLLGELAFAPFNRLVVFGVDIGPRSLYLMGGILVINLVFILLFFKELKLSTFDAGLAASLGFMPWILHYGLMTLVSVTAVGAFDAVGSILVVALMIGPPAAAYLLTERLSSMLILSAIIGIVGAIAGFWIANWTDVSIAGTMASMIGVVFVLVYVFSPGRGLLATVRRRILQKWEFALAMLVIHLSQHENQPEAVNECRADHLTEHIRWNAEFARRVVRLAKHRELIVETNGHLRLTSVGHSLAARRVVG